MVSKRKVWWTFQIQSCFADQDGPHEYEFWVFANSEMNVKTVRAEKEDEQRESFV